MALSPGSAAALGIGPVRNPTGAGIDRLITVRFEDRIGDAKRAHHIPVCWARGIDRADILIIKVECQAAFTPRLILYRSAATLAASHPVRQPINKGDPCSVGFPPWER
jgi:hypothetical protein